MKTKGTPVECRHKELKIDPGVMHGYVTCSYCGKSFHPAELLVLWGARLRKLENEVATLSLQQSTKVQVKGRKN